MRPFLAIWSVLFCLWGVVVSGRAFLLIAESPVQAEVVVQFLGPDDAERRATAVGLLAQGAAPLLMVPGIFTLLERTEQGKMAQIPTIGKQNIFFCRSWGCVKGSTMMEDTHKEMLLAKCAMDRLQLHSAILVSSPYHMRRIRLIADRVFDPKQYRIHCVPAVNGHKVQPRRSARTDWWWLTREYPKILWFFLYEPFLSGV